MMRGVIAVIAAVSLAGCGLGRLGGGQPEPGPEQFAFHVVPGEGAGEEASVVAEEMASGVVSDASLVGTVATPLGEFQIVTYTETADGLVMSCRAVTGDVSASGACESPPRELEARQVEVSGVGVTDDWSTVDVVAGSDVVEVVARAEDGTTYRSDVAEGYALLVYPSERGGLAITGLDEAGEAVGPPVEVEEVPAEPVG
jgi:hypothetical protein